MYLESLGLDTKTVVANLSSKSVVPSTWVQPSRVSYGKSIIPRGMFVLVSTGCFALCVNRSLLFSDFDTIFEYVGVFFVRPRLDSSRRHGRR